MSEDRQDHPTSQAPWLTPLIWIAAACLGVLILSESLGFSTDWLRGAMIIGVCIAGTGIIIVQAKRECPKCGARYGYHLRLLNQNICRQCGAEFPGWPSGDRPE